MDRHRTTIGDWRLDETRDHFSGRIACRLEARSGEALVRGQAAGFRFGRFKDVADAIYRIDGGPLRASRDDRPELVRLGTDVETGGIENPTNGIVWIPLRSLADANAVVIQPRPGDRPGVFHFRGMRGLYSLAIERGCTPGLGSRR